jgi:hypothetical protein
LRERNRKREYILRLKSAAGDRFIPLGDPDIISETEARGVAARTRQQQQPVTARAETDADLDGWAPGQYSLGRGLYVRIYADDRQQFIHYWRHHGKRRSMLLPSRSLTTARAAQDECRRLALAGLDPLSVAATPASAHSQSVEIGHLTGRVNLLEQTVQQLAHSMRNLILRIERVEPKRQPKPPKRLSPADFAADGALVEHYLTARRTANEFPTIKDCERQTGLPRLRIYPHWPAGYDARRERLRKKRS